jgi:hypothetical protein
MSVGDPNAAKVAFEKALEDARKREAEKVVQETRAEIGKLWGGKRHRVSAKRFCSCIKKVKSQKNKKSMRSEGSSIAICTSSLLWPHGRTLHSVTCRRKAHLKTQKRSRKA